MEPPPKNPRSREVSSQAPRALRVMACGGVDDGKSTLLGRLLLDTDSVRGDLLLQLHADSRRYGRAPGSLDTSLLLDGLESERERAVTIDVAYRQFSWKERRFLLSDCPGHIEYVRNMVGGASTAEVCLVVVDVRTGLSDQSRLHLQVSALFGVRELVVAVNKMDLVNYEPAAYRSTSCSIKEFLAGLGINRVSVIPVVAVSGGNVVHRSPHMEWYEGPTMVEILHASCRESQEPPDTAILPVQWVSVGSDAFRGFAGPLLSGRLNAGKDVTILPSGRRTSIKDVFWTHPPAPTPGSAAVTVTLVDSVDVRRGDVIVDDLQATAVSSAALADVIWLSNEPFSPGRRYILKSGFNSSQISSLDIVCGIHPEAQSGKLPMGLGTNDIARCKVHLVNDLVLGRYENVPFLGGFIVIDVASCETVAAGVIQVTYGSDSQHTRAVDRTSLQGGRVIWLTGISGAGKSTIAAGMIATLSARGMAVGLLDGDEVRKGLSSDLGYTDQDRSENVRRVAHVAKLMVDAGLTVIVSLISPSRRDRLSAKACIGPDRFSEVFVDAPLSVAEFRDVKGLYRQARRGEIPHFTQIDSAYEAPSQPDAHVQTDRCSVDQAVATVLRELGLHDAGSSMTTARASAVNTRME